MSAGVYDLPIASVSDARCSHRPGTPAQESFRGSSPYYRGSLLAAHLNAACGDAGYSLDKTYYLCLEKVMSRPGVAMHPELYYFGVRFGFVDMLTHLTKLGPEHRSAKLETGVFSQATANLALPETTHQAAQPTEEDFGSTKADSYYEDS